MLPASRGGKKLTDEVLDSDYLLLWRSGNVDSYEGLLVYLMGKAGKTTEVWWSKR